MIGDDDPRDDDSDETEGAEQPELFNAAEPKQVQKRESKAKRAKRLSDAWWRRVLADPVGRAQMWGIIQTECHAFEERFACGPVGFPDANATWFEAGRQSVGQRLYQTLMTIDPMNTHLMLIENDPRFSGLVPKEAK